MLEYCETEVFNLHDVRKGKSEGQKQNALSQCLAEDIGQGIHRSNLMGFTRRVDFSKERC